MVFKHKFQEFLLHCIFYPLYIVTFLIPDTLLSRILYIEVQCEACGYKMLRRRGWKKVYPQVLKDLPIKCDNCCSPKELKRRESLIEKYAHLL